MTPIETSPLVQAYLSRLLASVKNAQRKKDLKDEVLNHLEAEVSKLMIEQNLNFDEAVSDALRNFGDPIQINKSFCQIYHPLSRQIAKWSFVAAGLTLIVATGWIGWKIKSVYEEQRSYVASVAPALESYLRDIDFLENSGLFSKVVRTNDAGVFLNVRIPWDMSGHHGRHFQIGGPHEISTSYGFNFYADDNSKFGKRKVKKVAANSDNIEDEEEVKTGAQLRYEALINKDLGWISSLIKYDHWDLFRTGPFQNATDQEKKRWSADYSTVPAPRFLELNQLAGHYLYRHLGKSASEAIRHVRHFAHLYHSTNTYLGNYYALDLLKTENHFRDTAREEGTTFDGAPEAIPPQIIQRGLDALKATKVFFSYNLLREPHVAQHLHNWATLPSIACGAITESTNLVRLPHDTTEADEVSADPTYLANLESLQKKAPLGCLPGYIQTKVSLREYRELEKDLWPSLRAPLWERMQNTPFNTWVYETLEGVAEQFPVMRNIYRRYSASLNQPSLPDNYKDDPKVSVSY